MVMSSLNKDSVMFPFKEDAFLMSLCVCTCARSISLANIFDIKMNRSNHTKYSCFVIHFMRKALSLSVLSILLVQVFHSCSLSSWKNSFLFRVYWDFFSAVKAEFCQILFLRWVYCVHSSSFCQCSKLHWFTNAKLIFCISEINPTWSWNLIFFICYMLTFV